MNVAIMIFRVNQIPRGSLVPISRVGRRGFLGIGMMGLMAVCSSLVVSFARASRNERWKAAPESPSPIPW